MGRRALAAFGGRLLKKSIRCVLARRQILAYDPVRCFAKRAECDTSTAPQERREALSGFLLPAAFLIGSRSAILRLALLLVVVSPAGAFARDAIDDALARHISRLIGVPAPDNAPSRDRAYRQFLQAVYSADSTARSRAVESYRRLDLPERQAYLGSLAILEARDLSQRGFISGAIHILTERRLVLDGIAQLDAAVSAHPDHVDIRVVRAMTYLHMPSLFGKFQTGFDDMTLLLTWIENGQVTIPGEDPLFRDQAALYYYAGRYFLKTGQTDQAREMFVRSSRSSPRSPFAHAARQRQQAIDGRAPP